MQNPEGKATIPRHTHGTSMLGTLVTVAALLGVAALGSSVLAATGVSAGAAWAIGGALGLAGASALAIQNHKEARNDMHAMRAYHLHKGYHHEPEVVKDDSLLHAMKGPSDIPERRQYIEEHYGVKTQSPTGYGAGLLALGGIIGIAVGVAVAAAVTPLAVVAGVGAGAAAYGAMFGVMAGTVAFGVSKARSMSNYSRYLDDLEQKERTKAEKQAAKHPQAEYDNHRSRPGSYAADVTASRQQGGFHLFH